MNYYRFVLFEVQNLHFELFKQYLFHIRVNFENFNMSIKKLIQFLLSTNISSKIDSLIQNKFKIKLFYNSKRFAQ